MSELFSAGTDSRPLAARMAPRGLDEFAGQEALLGKGKLLRRLVESGRFTSAIFFGPPGCGKTALARYIAEHSNAEVVELNAVTAGVADIRKAVEQAKYSAGSLGRKTLLLVDEIHHFNKTQQDALLPSVERGDVLLIGMTTENPGFYVNAALRSRVTAFEFMPVPEGELDKILSNAINDNDRGISSLRIIMTPEAKIHLVRQANGDARRLLNALEIAALTTTANAAGERRITLDVAEESIQRRQIRYDKKSDDHYDHISAFIKSIRGTDPDAALYWMAKMLEAGEDPRFIARRILIAASEDVGNADFRALLVAEAAFRSVEVLGMPEARITLAQAVTFVASAPKSNAAYLAIDAATAEVRTGPSREVPLHLRDASMDAKERGHGAGYKYPHGFPGHHVSQEYMPNPMRFYEPSDQGDEKRIAERLKSLKSAQ
ncbi:MAG: replication-associated recombination protein A [Elusimicrobia bacterium]|nr:replication-associated recombination protein A [Elusimicrobiota bacterium]